MYNYLPPSVVICMHSFSVFLWGRNTEWFGWMVLTHGSNEASIQLSRGAAASSESSAEGRYVLRPIMWSPEGPSVVSS